MCECAIATGAGVGFRFWQDDVNLGVRFDGGQITSDGGLPWVVEAEAALGVCAALAGCVPEWRRGRVRHSLVTLVRQRVFQIACGYEDQNDAVRGSPPASLWTWTGPPTRPMASRRGSSTMAPTASTCTIRCSSSMAIRGT